MGQDARRCLFAKKAAARFLLLWGVACSLFLLSTDRANSEGEILYFPPYPQGEVVVSEPNIGWQVQAEGAEIKNVVMTLDGTSVDVAYDEVYGYVHQPAKPLEAGDHRVTLRLVFDGLYQPLEQSWHFSILEESISLETYAAQVDQNLQKQTLEVANDYRSRLGLPSLQIAPALIYTAEQHANYLHLNDELSHFEQPNRPGFFASSVQERALKTGYYGSVAEDISQQHETNPVFAVDGLFDAPYHRIPFMMPQAVDWGYDRKGMFHVINVGLVPQHEVQVVYYPTEDEQGIPTQWEGREVPDPLRIHPGAALPVGYPIMLGVYGDEVEQVALQQATLRDEEGVAVPLYINTPQVDDHLSREVILMPQSPLQYAHSYQVDVSLRVQKKGKEPQTVRRQWTFTTEDRRGQGKEQLHQRNRAKEAVEDQVIDHGVNRPESPAPDRTENAAEREPDDSAAVFKKVFFHTDLPFLQRLSREYGLPLFFSERAFSFADFFAKLDGHLGLQWSEPESNLTWDLGRYHMEWDFKS